MKKIVIVFPRQRYGSDGEGRGQAYLVQEGLISIIGGADDIRWEVTTYAVSGPNVRLQVSVMEGTKSDARPASNMFSGRMLGSFPAGTPVPSPELGAVEFQTNGPFAGLVDAVLKVWDSAEDSQQWVDAEVRATLSFR